MVRLVAPLVPSQDSPRTSPPTSLSSEPVGPSRTWSPGSWFRSSGHSSTLYRSDVNSPRSPPLLYSCSTRITRTTDPSKSDWWSWGGPLPYHVGECPRNTLVVLRPSSSRPDKESTFWTSGVTRRISDQREDQKSSRLPGSPVEVGLPSRCRPVYGQCILHDSGTGGSDPGRRGSVSPERKIPTVNDS